MKRIERIIEKNTGEWVRRNIQETPFIMTLENIDSEILICDNNISDLQDDIKELRDKKASLEELKLAL